MSVTDKLLQLDGSLRIHGEGEWDKSIFIKPTYTSFNDAGLECEVGELLYSFVRVLQPDNVLETGTHVGIGASYMGMALQDNLKGHLDTLEFLPPLHKLAGIRISTLGLKHYVTCHLTDASAFQPKVVYDLILLDTEPQTRFSELVRYDKHLRPGGFVFIHDLHRHMGQMDNQEHGFAWPWGIIPNEMKEFVRQGKYRPFHFGNPRGLTGFYKVHPDDYKW